MSVERLFDELGHFGRFQACLYFTVLFQAVSCGIHYLASVFLIQTPDFLCVAPGNVTAVLYGNRTAPTLQDIWPLVAPGDGPVVVQMAGGEQWELTPCGHALRSDPPSLENVTTGPCVAYAYDDSQVALSVVTQWDLVCERAWLARLCQPTFMLGVLIGALLFGDVADRIGRRPVLAMCSMCQFGFGVCVAFTGNYYYFLGARFLLAMVSSGYLVVVFVYVTEFTGNRVRTWTSMHVHAAFALGILVVALVGYLVRTWWLYQVILSLSTCPFLLVCWLLPETPFYLMAKDRHNDAQNLLDSMARFNGQDACLRVAHLLEPGVGSEADSPEARLSILDLFSSWAMAGRTLTVWAVWFIGSLGYYVFSLGSVNLGGSQYINLALAGAVEIPSYLIGCFAMDRMGRKRTCAPALLLAGAVCLLIIVLPKGDEVLPVVLSMMGKFAIAIAFGLIYLYTCELYPTVIRSLAVGSGSMMCRVGSVVAPFCVYLAEIWLYLPQLLVGILAFGIGLLTLLLPETLGRPLTTTMKEAVELGQTQQSSFPEVEEQALMSLERGPKSHSTPPVI